MSSNSSPGASAGAGAPTNTAAENILLSNYLYYALAITGGILVVFRVWTAMQRYVRTTSSLGNETQRYWAVTSWKESFFKQSIQYAPIFRKRHNREFALSAAVNMGTLPTRLQLLVLAAYLATNIAFCVLNIGFHGDFNTWTDQLRNRTGVLAVVNMVPLFLMAGRNNPLIRWLGISFDTFNLLHRWLGRIVVLEALVHTLAYYIGSAMTTNLSTVFANSLAVPFIMWGFVGTVAFVIIGIQASSISRHAFYETFKIFHILLAILAVVGTWYHLKLKNLPQLKYMYAVVALWVFDRAARFLRLGYGNIGKGGTSTLVEALPGNACRVTVTMARPWHFAPGQHAYLYFPTIGFWQSHPFSVAWSSEATRPDDMEKLPVDRNDILTSQKTSMSFIIRARTGLTASLYNKAAAAPDGRMHTSCLVEGPYGGTNRLHSYGTVMLFAGGVGITQAVPHLRDLVIGYSNGTVAARKIVLVWVIQSPEHLEWIRPWMTEILAMEKRREVLRIMLFVSRPRSTKEIHSPSATVQMFPGRPNIDTLLGMEMDGGGQVGALGVTVCGPGALSDEVRASVRKRQYQGSVDFVEEAFSW